MESLSVAVLVPCYNEEATVGEVVREFSRVLPNAVVYVYDNNSSDRTAEIAAEAGAVVREERHQGKGNVVRRMFADVDADIYVMVDGDMTYDAPSAPEMIRRLTTDNLDMVVGTRLDSDKKGQFRTGHYWGNIAMTRFVSMLFGARLTDIFSGYRVFSRRYAKSFPAVAEGFEVEAALTIHALQLRMPVAEMATPYWARPSGSESKLRTYRDGLRVLWAIAVLFKELRPLLFFTIWAVVLATFSVVLAYPIFLTYLQTGLVPRFPTAVAAAGSMILAFISLNCGLILDSVSRGRQEARLLAYLAVKSPTGAAKLTS